MSLMILYLLLARAEAIPQYASLVHRGTNTTLLVPSSFSDEPEPWRKNVYILQLTRITLLIFLAILVHFVYARWRIHKQLAPPSTSTQLAASMIEMIESGEVSAIESILNDQASAQTSMTSIPIRAMPVSEEQPVYLRPPPPTHLSSRICMGVRTDAGVLDKFRGSNTEQKPVRRTLESPADKHGMLWLNWDSH